jgi:hydrogenase maturation protease
VTGRMLIAGVGNIFLGDDGFGVEVANRLARADLPGWVTAVDYGIRGMHLAYDLADGFDSAILIDATSRGGEPGTIYVLEPELRRSPGSGQPSEPGANPETGAPMPTGNPLFNAHGMQPDVVLDMLGMLGGNAPRVLVVGCEPASVTERIGLSEPVAAAVGTAVDVVLDLVARMAPDEAGATSTRHSGAER